MKNSRTTSPLAGEGVLSLLLMGILLLGTPGRAQVSVSEAGSSLGWAPPGHEPKPFAEEILSGSQGRLHSFPAISRDGNEMYWAVIPPKILFSRRVNGKWTRPEVAPFSERNIQAPVFSSDGNRLFFQISKEGGFGSLDIWYVEREGEGWSLPRNLGSPPNSQQMESQPSFTRDGTVYFTGSLDGVLWNRGIYRSRMKDGKYGEPERLKAPVNSGYIDAYPFIMEDESLLFFSSSRPDSVETSLKLFASRPVGDDGWSRPVNLNEIIGIDGSVRFASVTPDNRYLVYMTRGKWYWVDMNSFLESIRWD